MRRGVIPPGKAGLLVLAAAMVPIVLGKAKPWAKKFGQGLVKLGEKLQEGAEEAAAEVQPEAAAPKAEAKPTPPKPAAAKATARPAPPKPAAAKSKAAPRQRKTTAAKAKPRPRSRAKPAE
ncbi:MAG: hypothetical protein M9921_14820 [Fimbriimonadaceae bacterium]|nr:hypothetical protein [Chthonomonadaceae bacterium]MCO5298119.1 hypothetical protein [Fimbriimonadaceae bacterium]